MSKMARDFHLTEKNFQIRFFRFYLRDQEIILEKYLTLFCFALRAKLDFFFVGHKEAW
jgi:hypothetical protein